MDDAGAVPVVPPIQLAKVGDKREKKRGGIPVPFGPVTVKVPLGLARALPSVGGRLSGKLVVMLLSVVFAVGARNIQINSRLAARREARAAAAARRNALSAVKQSYDPAEVAKAGKTAANPQDSLGMVSGGRHGAPEQGQAPDQSAKTEEAQAPAEAPPPADAKGGPAGAAAPAAGLDPAATAAAAADAEGSGKRGAGKVPFKRHFGALSSELGGGAGLSGGVGQTFSGPKLGERFGKASAFQSGAQPRIAGAQRLKFGATAGRGLAARQLNQAFRTGNAARSSPAEQAAVSAGSAFENNPGQGQLITGAGAGVEGPGGLHAARGGGDAGGGGGAGGTGPTEAAGIGQEQFRPPDDCLGELGEDYANTPAGGCYRVTAGQNVTPWQMIVNIAAYCLIISAALMLTCSILGLIAGTTLGALYPVIAMLSQAAALMAGIATLLGLAAMAQGAYIQGGIIALAGGFMTIQALVYASGAGDLDATNAETAVNTVAAPLFNMVPALLGGADGVLTAINPDTNGDAAGGHLFNPDGDGATLERRLDQPPG